SIPVVGLELIVGAGVLARERRLRLWPWAAAPLALVAGYVPWLLFARSSIVNYDVGRGSAAGFGAGLMQTLQALAVGFSSQLTVRNTGFAAEFQPNGYRELAGYLGRHAAAGDSMVLDGTSQWPLYWYYGQLRQILSQRVEFLPRETEAATERDLHDLLAAGGVWYLESDVDRYDPRHDVQRLLARDGYQALDVHFAGQRAEYF